MKYSFGFFLVSLFTFSKAQILTQWTPFSDCSATCNTGNSIRTRTRSCTPANLCQGISLFDTTSCNVEYSCPDYRLGDWGTWSSCSESCRATQSNPTRVRTRSYCLSNSTSAYQCTSNFMVSYEPCNTVACSTVKSCNHVNFTFVFVLDSSSSVEDQEWMDEKGLVLSFVKSSAFGVNPNVDVAVVNYGSTAQVEADCGTFKSYSTFETFMNNLKMVTGGTAIHRGLTTAETVFQRCQKLNMNPVIVLLTDGFENIDTNIDSNIAIENRIKSEALLVAGAVHEYKKDEIDRITSYIVNGQNVSYNFFATNFTYLRSGFADNLYNFVVGKSQCETQGQWTSWTTWENCSQLCGVTGYMKRSRSCMNPITSKIQEDCELDGNKANLDYMTCIQPCASFSEWSSWGACSASCNLDSVPPKTSRFRSCLPGLGSCIGSLSETQECNTNTPCQGIISSWGAWSQCSATCQLTSTLPTQQRSRTCVGATLGGNCDGQSTVDSQTCSVGIYCPGTISDWSFWGACSSICNNLVNIPFQTRSRSCIGYSTWDPNYTGCPGITKSDQQSCNVNVACSGSYGEWSAWSSCSESCQSNPAATPFQTQTRPCLGATLGGGCAGPSSQTMACNTGVPCPGILSGWSTWGACSSSCQLDYTVPTQTSTRTCSGASLGGNCNGQALTQTKNCNAEVLCPGALSGWGSWSACSASCNTQVNGPYQYRSQTCIGASIWNPNYVGCNNVSLNDQQLCNQNVPCPGNYGAWSAWGACSETCQSNTNVSPFQTQTRQCLGATLNGGCTGTSSQTQNCNTGVSCPGFISAWGAWGACSASCQLSFTSPSQTRNRQCVGATFNGNCNGAVLTDTQNCNEQVYCPGTISDWSSWGACSSICNNLVNIPFQTRSRSCIGYSTWDPNYTGCPGITKSDQQSCNVNVACSGSYGEWSAWSSCSESCQSNPAATPFQTQTRPCLGATLGGGCAGPSSQTMACNSGVPCPGILSGWSTWGACSASCQLEYIVPTQTSTRTCSGASLGGNCNGQALTQTKNCNAEVLCPGTLSGWGSWSACSASCNTQVNGPYQYRSQSCIGASIWNPNYVGCNNVSLNDQQLCNQNVPCPGNYGAWSTWGACSESCQSNPNVSPIQTQTRQCIGATLNGGCPGTSSQTQSCNTGISCPGFISTWGAWGVCSASCQLSFTPPTQTRNRQCVGATFNGNCNGAVLTDTQNCNEQVYCQGTISDWSSWGACSSICNNLVTVPFQTRSRSCIGYSTWDPNYTGCPGITKSDQQSCNVNVACSGSYGAWSAWSSCSESCQSNPAATPFQTQTRPCLGATLGGGCAGPSSQTMACNSGVPCPGVLSGWSTWGACSASCQLEYTVPTQTSTRTCSGASLGGNCNGQALTQTKNCNAEVICPGTLSGWGAWSVCSASCNTQVNGPYQYRSQSCIGASTWNPNLVVCGGASLNDQQFCNQNVPCPGFYTAWSAWSSCSESCQSNINNSPTQFHTRTCQNFTLNGGCVGVSSETQNCNSQVSCPGDLTQWSGFSACSQSCQIGSVVPTMNRVRSCLNPTFGGNCQGQSLTDVQPCNAGVACPGQLTDWTSWSQCPATCQQTVGQYNLQYRSRQCVNASLNGNCGGAVLNDQTPCVKDVPCPGILSQWSTWSSCSESCRSNLLIAPSQTRTRTCTTATLGANCGGASLVESLSCNANVGCPGVWTSWGPFTDCSASCQSTGNIVPTQSRQRFCVNNTLDGPCPSDNNGDKIQTVQCNVGVICPVRGTWSTWGAWSTCSASCDAGIIQRSRACSVPYPIGAGDDCTGNTTQTLPCKLFDCPKSCAIAKRCNCSQVKQWSSVPTFDQFQSRGLTHGAIETVLRYLSSYGDDTVDKACQACNTMMLTTLRSNVADQLSQAKAARAKLELIKNDLRDVIYCNGVILNNAGLWSLYDLMFEHATMLDGVIIELNAIYLRFDAALTSCQSYGWIHQTFKTILRKCTF